MKFKDNDLMRLKPFLVNSDNFVKVATTVL